MYWITTTTIIIKINALHWSMVVRNGSVKRLCVTSACGSPVGLVGEAEKSIAPSLLQQTVCVNQAPALPNRVVEAEVPGVQHRSACFQTGCYWASVPLKPCDCASQSPAVNLPQLSQARSGAERSGAARRTEDFIFTLDPWNRLTMEYLWILLIGFLQLNIQPGNTAVLSFMLRF